MGCHWSSRIVFWDFPSRNSEISYFDLCLIWLHLSDPKLINAIGENVCFFSRGPDWTHHDSKVTPESQRWEIPTPAAVDEMDIDPNWNPTTSWSSPHLGFSPPSLIWASRCQASTTYHPNYSTHPLYLLFLPLLWPIFEGFQCWVQFKYSEGAFKALNRMTIKKNEMENKGLTNETAWKADERTYEEIDMI